MIKKLILGVTGASGMIYVQRFLNFLPEMELHVIVSKAAARVMVEERLPRLLFPKTVKLFDYVNEDIGASIASGSFKTDGMVILPCSMTTLAALAQGLGDNLIRRAADVCIKEKRKLVVVPRETPFSGIHLENMLRLNREGVSILPANPGFYHQPQTLEDIADFVVQKIYDQLGIEVDVMKRWGKAEEKKTSTPKFFFHGNPFN